MLSWTISVSHACSVVKSWGKKKKVVEWHSLEELSSNEKRYSDRHSTPGVCKRPVGKIVEAEERMASGLPRIKLNQARFGIARGMEQRIRQRALSSAILLTVLQNAWYGIFLFRPQIQ